MKKTLIDYWKQNYNFDRKVIQAFKNIPREKFVLRKNKREAYADMALPILLGQTISQPTTVMLMLNALEVERGDKILEVGTGSGYQTALLSELVGKEGQVISLEIIPELKDMAKKNLRKVKLNRNMRLINTDGSKGYEKYAPYDKIIMTAASPKINPLIIEQLNRHGKIVMPVGHIHQQRLIKITKERELITENLGDYLFVPLRGEQGY